MEIVTISKANFKAFVDEKIKENTSRIVSVVSRNAHYSFDDLESADQMCLDYDVTILPPKKYFKPPKETLLKYVPKDVNSFVAVNECAPVTLIGVHYYDLAAIHLMDRAFSEGERDDHYLRKRENSLIIGMYPTRHYRYRFSKSVVRDQPYKVADVMMIDMDDHYVLELVTEKGKAFLSNAKTEANTYSLKEIDDKKNSVKDDQKIPVPIELTPDYLARNFEHPVWKYFGDKCFSCGACVLVCPTCYCFDVIEEVELSLAEGKRVRVWDGCMLEEFALVAGGHNFRPERDQRFRHRIVRKGKHLPEKYHYWGCVGCGRCQDACPADIAGPVKVFKYMEDN